MMFRIVSCAVVAFALPAALTFNASSANAQAPQPSAEHEGFKHEVGVWDAESKTWMAPDAEPILSKGVETNRMHGPMWLVSEFESEIMGAPYNGHGQFGYDPKKQKYVGTWIDNYSPHLTVMEGTMDEATKTLTMMSEGYNMMTGEKETSKMVSKMIDDDHKKFEIFGPVPGKPGEWWKKMEINYTRRK